MSKQNGLIDGTDVVNDQIKKNKYKQLEKVIQDANPEIMELKFGCELLRKTLRDGWQSIYYVLTTAGQGRPEGHIWISSIPFGSMVIDMTKDEISNGGEFEIIGRPIRLSDVIVALSKQSKGYFFTQDGDIPDEEYTIKRETLRVLYHWNCEDDNLSHQTEETISFLHAILC